MAHHFFMCLLIVSVALNNVASWTNVPARTTTISRVHIPTPFQRKPHALYSSSDEILLEQMRKVLGDREDIFDAAETENRQMLQGIKDLDRDPNVNVNARFMEWLDNSGVWVKTVSAWGKAPHPLVIASNTEDDGESCGRGILARESVGEGELLVTIPLDLCLTKAVAQDLLGKSVVPDDMDEYLAIALLLMTEKLKGSDSEWKPYIDILPQAKDVYPSFLWSTDELDWLKGSPTYYASISLRKKLEREYQELSDNLFKRFPEKYSPQKYSLAMFTWAFVMLFSRAARLSSKSNGEELALVPYADLMNHNTYSNTYIDAQKSGLPLISRTEEVALYADRSYKQFEQVFINYGEKSNADLLLLYGFALEKNLFNSVDIAVGLSKDDPLFQQKKVFLDKSGRGVQSVRFPLQQDRYPSELVDFLRLLLVEPEDLGLQTIDKVDFNEPISPSLERRVLSTMISICESYLEQYPTAIEDDEKLVADRKMFASLTRQHRMAIKLRLSEKNILLQTISAVSEELGRLPAVVVGDQIRTAGRSFESFDNRAKTIKSAEKMASLNTWVDIREDKNKVAGFGDDSTKDSPKSSIAERRRRRRSG